MGTSFVSYTGAAGGGPYPYDTYASSLNLENRWRLNTNLSTNGNTETSIGTLSTAVTVDVTAGNLNLTSGVTNGTSDAQSQSKTDGAGTILWAAPAGGIPATFTVGMWYRASTANAGIEQALFCVGASPTYTGTYHGVEVYVTGSGGVVVQYGDSTGNVSSDRISYATAAGAITRSGAPVFIALRSTKASTSGTVSFQLLINGVIVPCSYIGGDATTIVWGDRVTFGSGHWGRFYITMFDPFDEPFFTSGLLTTTQILQLYNYGVTP